MKFLKTPVFTHINRDRTVTVIAIHHITHWEINEDDEGVDMVTIRLTSGEKIEVKRNWFKDNIKGWHNFLDEIVKLDNWIN